jgi:hypothetical protein
MTATSAPRQRRQRHGDQQENELEKALCLVVAAGQDDWQWERGRLGSFTALAPVNGDFRETQRTNAFLPFTVHYSLFP